MKSNILFILEKRISKKNIDGFLSHLSPGNGFMMQDKCFDRHVRGGQVTSFANCTCNIKPSQRSSFEQKN